MWDFDDGSAILLIGWAVTWLAPDIFDVRKEKINVI